MTEYRAQADSIKQLRLARLLSLIAKAGSRGDFDLLARLVDVVATDYQCAVQLCIAQDGVIAELRST